ncbi:MAG TPA: FAA hydrolase family protein [Gemmatimonadetes bacterium]|nr:FAA hydrolase family protein [Gemmatimonadota bacterium]
MTPPPSKIVCVGKNFHAHAAELGSSVPAEPLIFLKPPSSLIASGEPIVVPQGVGRVDYEGEIAVRIGTRARHVSGAEAWSVIEGVFPLNDVTARDLQKADNQWSRAKGFDTFCPIGSVSTVSPEDFPDVTLVTRVNGDERQRAKASDMVFSIPNLISYITRIMTLEPGDIVSPGTPEGVGALSPGDEVEVELEGLDVLRNPVEGEGDVGS